MPCSQSAIPDRRTAHPYGLEVVPGGTLEDCVDVDAQPTTGRRRTAMYGVTAVSIVVVLVLASAGTFGVGTRTVRSTGGRYELRVRYGEVSRPALATPFEIEVRRQEGFEGPVTVAVIAEYLRMWDENGLFPTPSSETTDGPWLVWEFEPPVGDTLRITYDGRIEPAAQTGERGAVEVRDADGDPIVSASFETEVLP